REKWKLPPDYPMVAPNYARKRSELARATGLGKKSAAKLPPSLQAVTSA
ncbi:MucR family transcriptional regulator, partial [Sinorhizobium meliloti]